MLLISISQLDIVVYNNFVAILRKSNQSIGVYNKQFLYVYILFFSLIFVFFKFRVTFRVHFEPKTELL